MKLQNRTFLWLQGILANCQIMKKGETQLGKKRWSRQHFTEVRDDTSGLPNWGGGPFLKKKRTLDNLPQLKRILCQSPQEKVDRTLRKVWLMVEAHIQEKWCCFVLVRETSCSLKRVLNKKNISL